SFLPVSQLSVEHYPRVGEGDRQGIMEEIKKFIGQELDVKVIDVNPRNNKIIVSEREVLSSNLKEALGKYEVGQIIDGIVSGIANFGIFVRFADNPDIEGMVHISELDHRMIENPKEIAKVNDEIKAKIIDIKEGRVFLSMKALKPNPWERVSELFKEGDEVDGSVYKLNPFGGVINLSDGLQGLIHVSAFGGQEEMKAALKPGESYKFVIESIKPEEKRIILKLKK
ncbi:MAG: S1 RNA-binding domain-containing protein, partial [Patescibacteria group bacterium]